MRTERHWFASFLLAGALACVPVTARAQAPVPASPPPTGSGGLAVLNSGDAAALELRATQTFNRGEYALALPLLQKVSDRAKDNPDKFAMLQEEIRVCRKRLASPAAVAAVAAVADQQASGLPDAEHRKSHPAPEPGQTIDLAIKELGNFEYDVEHGGNIPADVKRLNAAKLRTRGFMIPLDQAENISEFALVPSLLQCCLGGPPQVQHTIVVHCPKGKAVSYYPDEIVVEGNLIVEERKDGDYIISIFELNASSVRPAPK